MAGQTLRFGAMSAWNALHFNPHCPLASSLELTKTTNDKISTKQYGEFFERYIENITIF